MALVFLLVCSGFSVEYTIGVSPDTVVFIGDTIWVEMTLTNNEASTIRGLTYSEQIPNSIDVIYGYTRMNDQEYDGIMTEIGAANEINQNYTPYRWVFQTPPDFSEAGSLESGDNVTIRYGFTSSSSISFDFNSDNWFGGLVSGDTLRALFGYNLVSELHLHFINPNAIMDENLQPRSLYLAQNYPNPFNASTLIKFNLNQAGPVKLVIYSLNGQKVMTLLDEFKNAGFYQVQFSGEKLASGIYYYCLQTFGSQTVRKMLLVK